MPVYRDMRIHTFSKSDMPVVVYLTQLTGNDDSAPSTVIIMRKSNYYDLLTLEALL